MAREATVRCHVGVILLAFSIATVVLACHPSFAQQEQTEAKRKILQRVAPVYPELARRMRINGSVRLEVMVAPSGTPKNPKILGGHPLLVQAATDAIGKWRWAPSTEETTELIEFKFNPD